MKNIEFNPWPKFSEKEAEIVSSILLSNKVNYWTGDEGRNFEKEFAKFIGTDYAIALSNGTVALDIAFKAIGISKGDEVIVTSRTFIASASSIVNAGATPVFADVNVQSQNITIDTVSGLISSKTKAILCVHLSGWPCDMDPIMKLANEKNLYVIEDCAQAHGAKYKGKNVGSIGHIGCWSFCQDKIMSTGGEGGMVTTNNKEFWNIMWSFKDHGKFWDTVYNVSHPPGFRWLHETIGTNWRMTEMQAALGRYQLQQLPRWHQTRLNYANQIWSTAKKIKKLRVPELKCGSCDNLCDAKSKCEHAAYKCYIFVDGSERDRDQIMAKINAHGVPCFSGSCSEVYLEKAFKYLNYSPKKRLPNAKKLGETSLMFLCHPSLTSENINKTCNVLEKVVGEHFK